MYRILIVDDEEMIRMGIKNSMPWDELGIKEVYTASSAAEGLRIIGEYKPHILLTDIYMSAMNGIELIEVAKDVSPSLKTIVLTGYNSFDYARDCLRLRVDEFLLKPVDEDELASAIVSVCKTIDADSAKKPDISDLKSRLQQEALMQSILEGTLDDIVVQSEFNHSCYRLAYFPISNNIQKNDYSFNMTMIRSICIENVDNEKRGITFCDKDGSVCVLFFNGDNNDDLLLSINKLKTFLLDEFELSLPIYISNEFSEIWILANIYSEIKERQQHEKAAYSSVVEDEVKAPVETSKFRRQLSACVGDSEQLLKTFNGFVKELDNSEFPEATVRRLCFETACDIHFSYIKFMGEKEGESLNAFAKSIVNMPKEELYEETRAFILRLHEKEAAGIHRVVETAKEYINENLTSDLSVKGIAAHLFVSPNYLSRLFKKVVGEGCNEYIVRKRMECAKVLLLTTNLKTYQIAKASGFNDNNYFSIAFKKHTGQTPSQYRNKI